jgi:diacylglycerol kinase family enzyme
LIVNPQATSTTPLRRDVIAHALASELELEVVETRYRGHAARLAAAAAGDGFGLVLTLGGDGTVNEAVNGIMGPPPAAGPSQAAPSPAARQAQCEEQDATGRPALASLPGGNANVFTRALGLPADPVDATGRILEALKSGRSRRIGLGAAGDRYFAFNAGLGFDAEVVRAVEALRADGQPASPGLYLWLATRHFFATDRRRPALALAGGDGEAEERFVFCIVSNTAPWTYLGRRALNPSPESSFESGLDLFALRKLGTVATVRALYQMLRQGGPPPHGRHVMTVHDRPGFTLSAERPMALQVDGEYVGEAEQVRFRSVPAALRIIA